MSVPIFAVSIALVVLSVIIALLVLAHKGRGAGLSDLFGGGMSTSMGGQSIAERRLDQFTIAMTVLWLGCIIALLFMYRFGI